MSSTRFLAAVAIAATLVLPVAASAQTAPASAPAAVPVTGASPLPGARHHHRHGGGFRRALHALSLSPAQQQQIDAVFAQNRGANANVTDAATRKANRRKVRAQIEAILTPAQRTQLQAELQKNKQHRPA